LDPKENRINEKHPFDVFLAHSSRNKRQIRLLAEQLRTVGLKPWLDSEQILAGRAFADEMSRGLLASRAVAICVVNNLGRWQAVELRAALQLAVDNGIPVIPVLLPGVRSVPEQLLFLRAFSAVRFSRNVREKPAMDALVRAVRTESSDA
jgi:hypothetical protein